MQRTKLQTKSKQKLKVYSLTRHKEKKIPKDAHGRYTTDPILTQLHLPEVLHLFSSDLPLRAHLFINIDSKSPLVDTPSHEEVILEREVTETSLICTIARYRIKYASIVYC